MQHAQTTNKNSLSFRIVYDEYPANPRKEFDNMGTLVAFHNRYRLSDESIYNKDSFDSWNELKKQIIKDFNPSVILPVYMYEHSGVSLSTSGFSCPWDSGQIGFIFVSRKKALEEYNAKRITKKIREKIETCLNAEIKEYSNYLDGEVYGYVIEEDGEIIDSCCGYYGREYAEEAAKESMNYYESKTVISLQ